MGNIIARGTHTYIILPRKDALLYGKFNEKESLTLHAGGLDVKLSDIISRDVKKSEYLFKTSAGETGVQVYDGEKGAQVLFNVFPQFCRGEIDPNKALKHPGGLENFLGKETFLDKELLIDPLDESIAETARGIVKQLPKHQRENPYAITDAITHWIKGNIEYIIIPKWVTARIAKTISKLPKEEKTDVYKVLKHSFNVKGGVMIKEDILRKIAKLVRIKEDVLPSYWQKQRNYELAKELVHKVDKVWGGLQFFWLADGENSAKKTLENMAGKCVGMSYLFAALSRSLGVPSRYTDGYYGPLLGLDMPHLGGDGHAWVASCIHPFGWVEVDPTLGKFQDFNYDNYAYPFSFNSEHFPKFTMFEKGKYDIKKGRELKEVIKLLKDGEKAGEKRNLFDMLTKRKTKEESQQYEEYIEFLKALKHRNIE